MKTFNFIKSSLILVLFLLFSPQSIFAGTVQGDSPLCPGTTGYYAFFRDNTNCTDTDWRVYENGSIKSSGWSSSGQTCTVNWSSNFSSGEVWVREKISKTYTYGIPPDDYTYTNYCDHWGDWAKTYVAKTNNEPYFSSISGVFCLTNTQTVSITTPCSGGTFDWEVPTGWEINGGSNTLNSTTLKSISVKAPSSGGGTRTIRVRQSGGSHNWVNALVQLGEVQSSQVNLGKIYNMYDYTMCPSANYAIVSTGPPSTEFTNWNFNGAFSSTYGYGNQAAVTTSYNYTGGYISVKAYNTCNPAGVIVGRSFSLSYSCPYSMMSEDDVKIYPNPATTELTVEWPKEGDVTEVLLFNEGQKVIKSEKVAEGVNSLTLDLRDVKSDTYFLYLTNGENTLKKQVLKK